MSFTSFMEQWSIHEAVLWLNVVVTRGVSLLCLVEMQSIGLCDFLCLIFMQAGRHCNTLFCLRNMLILSSKCQHVIRCYCNDLLCSPLQGVWLMFSAVSYLQWRTQALYYNLGQFMRASVAFGGFTFFLLLLYCSLIFSRHISFRQAFIIILSFYF